METEVIKICSIVHPYYCPKCKLLYYTKVKCKCPNIEIEAVEKFAKSQKSEVKEE